MKRNLGQMDVPFSETYNEEDDVYYVTFKTGEPSYCVEVDDVLLLEVGMFTNLPTGFRILNFKEKKVHAVGVGVLIKKMHQTLKEVALPSLGDREAQVKRALQDVLS